MVYWFWHLFSFVLAILDEKGDQQTRPELKYWNFHGNQVAVYWLFENLTVAPREHTLQDVFKTGLKVVDCAGFAEASSPAIFLTIQLWVKLNVKVGRTLI